MLSQIADALVLDTTEHIILHGTFRVFVGIWSNRLILPGRGFTYQSFGEYHRVRYVFNDGKPDIVIVYDGKISFYNKEQDILKEMSGKRLLIYGTKVCQLSWRQHRRLLREKNVRATVRELLGC